MENNKTLADFVGGGLNNQGAFMDLTTPNFIVALTAFTNILNSRYPVVSELNSIKEQEITQLSQFAVGVSQIFCQVWEGYIGQQGGASAHTLRPHRQSRAA